MHPSLRSALVFSLAAGAVTAVACGGNVVVDGAAGAAGAGGTGVGGSVTTTFTTTTTTLTTTTTMTSPCVNHQDEHIFGSTLVFPAEAECALANLGNDAGLSMCLTANVGLTSACTACLVNDLQCAVQHCPNECGQSPASQACASCRVTNCEPAWSACTGFSHDTGITNCATVLGNILTTTWTSSLPPFEFTTAAAQSAYDAYDQCACGGTGPCATACIGDYCGGSGYGADTMCVMCLAQSCAMQTVACQEN